MYLPFWKYQQAFQTTFFYVFQYFEMIHYKEAVKCRDANK